MSDCIIIWREYKINPLGSITHAHVIVCKHSLHLSQEGAERNPLVSVEIKMHYIELHCSALQGEYSEYTYSIYHKFGLEYTNAAK